MSHDVLHFELVPTSHTPTYTNMLAIVTNNSCRKSYKYPTKLYEK